MSGTVFIRLLILWFVLGTLSSQAEAQGPTGILTRLPRTKRINLIFSVDWEGTNLNQNNLRAMATLRQKFPDLRFLQLLNPAYFTNTREDPSQVVKKIKSVLREGDELGLHVHAWKSLIEAAGVPPRLEPTFYGKTSQDGSDVILGSFTPAQLRKILKFSVGILEKNGFGRPTTFRSPGCDTTPEVLAALAAENFLVDSSAVPDYVIEGPYIKDGPRYERLKNQWPDITATTPPYIHTTPEGKLWEIPLTGALADYVTEEEMVEVFSAAIQEWKKNQDGDVFVQIGIHQETAEKYLSRITSALVVILEMAKREQIPVELSPFPLINHLKDTHRE